MKHKKSTELSKNLLAQEYTRRVILKMMMGSIASVGTMGSLSAILAACSGPSAVTPAPQSGEQAAATTTLTEAAARSLVIAVPTDPEGLDPDTGAVKMTYTTHRHLYSFLTQFKIKDAGEGLFSLDRTAVEPLLAKEFTVSDDGKMLKFVLRNDLQFPSGNPFRMADVLYSFERMIGTGGLGAFELGVGSISSMDQLKAEGDQTLIITLPQADPLVQAILGLNSVTIYDSELMKANATKDDPWAQQWAKRNPAGLGPYILDEYTVGRDLIFSPNPNHPVPGKSGLIFKIIPAAETRALSLEKGDVDMALALPFRLVKSMEEKPGLRVLSSPSLYRDVVHLNQKFPPLDNKLVRQALSYAVPYQRLISEVYYGYADPAYGPIMKGLPGYDESAWIYKEDLDKARSLLAEAGHADGFSVELTISDDEPRWEPVADLLRQNFAQIGVDLQIQKQTLSVVSERLFNRELAMSLEPGIPWVADPWYPLFLWHHSEGFANFDEYKNSELDQLLDRMRFVSGSERVELAKTAQRMVIEDAPQLWLGQPRETIVLRENITGYLFTGEDSDYFGFVTRT